MVLAPLTQLADIQSDNTFFYVFTHKSIFNDYDVVNDYPKSNYRAL